MKSGELQPGDFSNYLKPFGKVVIPVYNNKVGIATEKKVIFNSNIYNEISPFISVAFS